jgi:hypothetical protein
MSLVGNMNLISIASTTMEQATIPNGIFSEFRTQELIK